MASFHAMQPHCITCQCLLVQRHSLHYTRIETQNKLFHSRRHAYRFGICVTFAITETSNTIAFPTSSSQDMFAHTIDIRGIVEYITY